MRRMVEVVVVAAAALMMAASAGAQTFRAGDAAEERQTLTMAPHGRKPSVATAGVPNSFSAGASGLQMVHCFSLGWNCATDCGENWLVIWDVYQCRYDDDYDGTWDRYGPIETVETNWCWPNPLGF